MAAPEKPIWTALAAPDWVSAGVDEVAEPPIGPASVELGTSVVVTEVVPAVEVSRVVLLPAVG